MSNGPVEQYTTSMNVGPSGKPGLGFSVRWNAAEKKLEFSGSFEIAEMLKALAAKGYIEIKKPLEGEDQYQTMRFDFPVRDEQVARMLAFGQGYAFISMLMGIASDLAKGGK